MLTMKQWRRAKEITQESMAEQLGIHVNTYINWEQNPGSITITNAGKIAKILGVSPNEIAFEPEAKDIITAAGI